jgi:hypothetical protein
MEKIKCNIQKARRLFLEGEHFRIVPSNCNSDNEIACMHLSLDNEVVKSEVQGGFCTKEEAFEKMVNSFRYYNCNSELGNRVHFYLLVYR